MAEHVAVIDRAKHFVGAAIKYSIPSRITGHSLATFNFGKVR